MPWRIEQLTDPRIIETKYHGVLSPDQLTSAADATIAAAVAVGSTLLLADCSGLEGGHSYVDLFWLADWLAGQPGGHRYREAIVAPGRAQALANVDFWETVCANRGVTVRCFHERDAAIAWLRSEDDRRDARS